MVQNPYRSPTACEESADVDRNVNRAGDTFASAVKLGVVVQVVLFVLTALILDGGRSNKMCIVAMIGYWIVVAVMMIRRRTVPTRTDLLFLRYGMLALLAIVPLLAAAVYRVIGESHLNGIERWF